MSNNEIKLRPTKGKITFNDNIILSVINLATKEIAGVSSIDNKHMFALKRWFNKNYADMEPEEFVKNILIDKLNVKKIVIGSNSTFGKDKAGNVEVMKFLGYKYGFKVCVVELMKEYFTNKTSVKICVLILY